MRSMKQMQTDVLIVGGGLSGLYTALQIDESPKITILVKEKLTESNSFLAQGGIAGVMNINDASLTKHIEDTIIAGVDLYDKSAIQALVYQAKENIEELIKLGVPFDVDSTGNILLTKEAGHSTRRILHAGGDATGQKIMETLIALVKNKPNITILENTMFYALIHEDNTCYGVKALDEKGEALAVFANHTILATGGIGAVYQDSTNSHIATGDGIAGAYRAGVEIVHMEFVQFHPTVFYDVKNEFRGQKFLISEALRGEGAILRNIEGNRFMAKYDERLELAPRDVVSLSIYKEMYDTWSDYVYLDARHLGKEFLKDRFPTIYQKCLNFGYHMESDLIPIAPQEHYGIGGIKIDLNGKTSMANLYANGECSNSGVHGANRLASNSLLECLVFGKRIANVINQSKPQRPLYWDVKEARIYKPYNYHHIRQDIRNAMQQFAFIVRKKEGLEIALKIISNHYQALLKYPVLSVDYYRALNIATVAKLIVQAALARKESIGCHYRID